MKIKITKKGAILLVLIAAVLVLSGCTMTQPDDTVGLNNVAPQVFQPVFTTPPPTEPPTPTPIPQQSTIQPPSTLPTVPAGIWQGSDQPEQTAPPIGTLPTSQATAGIQTVPTIGPTSVPTATKSIATASPAPATSTLRKGSKGGEVKSLQQKLKELGYYSGSVDSDYGTGTVTAVKAFQKANGLKADGVAGKATLDKLSSSDAKKNTATTPPKGATTKPTAKPTAKPTPTPKPVTVNPDKARYLKVENNMSGKDVTQLQSRLISLGYLTGKTDGNYGYRTEAAVKAFQKRMGIWDDGIAGPDTQVKIHDSGAKKANGVVAHIGTTLKAGGYPSIHHR